jgi:hypothetical protein
MRSAGNFHPEWGYLAPAPSFLRTARTALVATAIGATAAAIVVVSLVERPDGNNDNTSIAAHALVTSAPVISSATAATQPLAKDSASVARVSAARIAVVPLPAPAQGRPAVVARTLPPVPVPVSRPPEAAASANEPDAASAPAPASVAALAETPASLDAEPATAQPDAAVAPDAAATKKLLIKKRRNESQAASNPKRRWHNNGGFGPLLHLFSYRTSSSSYSN